MRERGSCWGRSVSHSMWPLIVEGDRVLVERTPREEVGFGDIVVFHRAGQLIVHRVVGKQNVRGREYFPEKGDNNLWAGLVPPSDVIGRVRAIEISGKMIWINSPRARLLQRILALNSYLTWRLWSFGQRVLPSGVKERVLGRRARRLFRLPARVLLGLLGVR